MTTDTKCNLLCKIFGHKIRMNQKIEWINYGIFEDVYDCIRCGKKDIFRTTHNLVVREQKSDKSLIHPCQVTRIVGDWVFEKDDVRNICKTWRT